MAFKKIYQENREAQTMQRNISTALTPVLNAEIVNGSWLTSVSLDAGQNIISHKLQRQILGAFVTKKSVGSDVFFLQADPQQLKNNMIIFASVACVADLWVF